MHRPCEGSHEAAAGAVTRILEERPAVTGLIVQNEASKARLIEEFTSSPATCLFATMGFWQGIDVPGSTLSLVVIDRIPLDGEPGSIVSGGNAVFVASTLGATVERIDPETGIVTWASELAETGPVP